MLRISGTNWYLVVKSEVHTRVITRRLYYLIGITADVATGRVTGPTSTLAVIGLEKSEICPDLRDNGKKAMQI